MSPRFQESEEDVLLNQIYYYINQSLWAISNHPEEEEAYEKKKESIGKVSVLCAGEILKQFIKYNAIRSRPIIFCDHFSKN